MSQPADGHPSARYSVFLVEDEVVAREGIRDNVTWEACGFTFAGEASDGEAALPIIEQVRPDVLITDIRMPFMDGLQLTRLVRSRLPSTHVLVLSGYDDFAFAQTAIQLGVVEYLLKPVSAADLERALLKMKRLLDDQGAAAADRSQLQNQVQESLGLRREDLLLRVCLGDVDTFEALDLGRDTGLALAARAYVVLIARATVATRSEPRQLQAVQARLQQCCSGSPDVMGFRKDIEEVVALVTGIDSATALARAESLAGAMTAVAQTVADARVDVGIGDVRERLSDVPHSFAMALQRLDHAQISHLESSSRSADDLELVTHLGAQDAALHLDRRALERFLRQGSLGDFDPFFSAYVGSSEVNANALRRYREYLMMDVTIAAATFVEELGGTVSEIVPEAALASAMWKEIHTVEDLRGMTRSIVQRVFDYRDTIVRGRHSQLIQHARRFIETQFADPSLNLATVASEVDLSPSHFSVLFSRETGETFKGFLTRIRMEHAKALLRSSPLPIGEVARHAGYQDPHYFSSAFKRACGVTPREFRETGVP
jgi:two-component system response regulator YesN